jgi:hypothetical protein
MSDRPTLSTERGGTAHHMTDTTLYEIAVNVLRKHSRKADAERAFTKKVKASEPLLAKLVSTYLDRVAADVRAGERELAEARRTTAETAAGHSRSRSGPAKRATRLTPTAVESRPRSAEQPPEGGRGAEVGRYGAMKPAGRAGERKGMGEGD